MSKNYSRNQTRIIGTADVHIDDYQDWYMADGKTWFRDNWTPGDGRIGFFDYQNQIPNDTIHAPSDYELKKTCRCL